MDPVSNLCKVTVNQGYNASDTSITIVSTDPNLSRVLDPATYGAYNLIWYDDTNYPGDPSADPNVEIVRVTSKTGNVLTVIRGQEEFAASTKNTGGATYKLYNSLTAKFATDLDAISVDVGEETKYVTEEISTGAPGAAGDGVTNDTTAIQDHITNGNLVIFPPGTYAIDEVTLKSALTLRGAGIGVTTIKLKDSSGASSVFLGTSIANVTIENLTIDGNKANNGSGLDGVQLVTSSDFIFRNVEIKNCKRHGINLGANSCLIDGCRFSSQDSSGVNVDGDSNIISSSRIASNVVGITVNTGSDNTLIKGCYFTSNTTKVTNSGTTTHARCNVGWVTEAFLQGGTHPGQTTGVVSDTIAHGLDVTPAAINCNLSMSWENSANPTDFTNIRGPYVMSCDATNIKVGGQNSVAGDTVTYRILVYVNVLP